MLEVNANPETMSADFTVEGGCPGCGGALDVRLTRSTGAWSYCPSCRWLSRPQVVFNGKELELAQPLVAQA
jgi:hypothetical protein